MITISFIEDNGNVKSMSSPWYYKTRKISQNISSTKAMAQCITGLLMKFNGLHTLNGRLHDFALFLGLNYSVL